MTSKGTLLTTVAMVVATVLMATAAPAEEGSAEDLVRRVRAAVPKVPLLARMTLTSDRGWVRELELSRKHQDNDVDAGYMEVTAPMDLKDTRFLVLDHAKGRDEQFIYVPSAKRAIQVGPQTRKQDFLGSEFAVGDLVQPDVDGFTYRFVGEEDVIGHHCKLVEAVPKNPDEEMYGKTISAVDPTDLVVVKGQIFDSKGALLKVFTVEKLEKIDDIWTPMVQQMTNVQENHWSKITLSEVKYNAQLPDDTFKRSHLTR